MKSVLKCGCCGISYEVYTGWKKLPVNSGSIGLCEKCSQTKGYNRHNEQTSKQAKQHGFTFGFELEAVPTSNDYLVLCNDINKFIPTEDCSLPYNGIEFKSPIYQSLNGLKKTLWTANQYLDMSNYKCGQHIHIGNEQYINYNNMEIVRKYYVKLFKPLSDYMRTVNYDNVYGRCFNDYASSINDYSDSYDRYNFINCSRDNTIEFRLCKFVNVNQYYWLFELNRDIVSTLINNFIAYIPDNDTTLLQHKAKLTGNKIVKVFEKYYAGQAHCQRPSRNDRQW